MPRATDVVKARAYVSLAPVPRGRAFEIAVVARIRPGFHVNAHEVSEEYLIPTALEPQLSPGLRASGFAYPPGALRKFKFSPRQLNVYEGTVTLRAKLQAAGDAPLGPQRIPLLLSYQACNDEACLPPTKITIAAEFEVAPAGAPAQPANPSIFAELKKRKKN